MSKYDLLSLVYELEESNIPPNEAIQRLQTDYAGTAELEVDND